MKDLVERLITILEEDFDARNDRVRLNAETELAALGLSSLNLMKLMVRLESTFEIEFADEDLDLTRLGRVQDLADYISQRCRGVA